MIYRPVRERDPAEIVDTVVRAVKKSGFDEVSLTSLSTADYSCVSPLIKKVVEKLKPENVSLGVSSLRAYGLEEDLLDEIGQVRATGLTFAPEAGTQRMRDVVNKNVTEEQLLETADRVFSRGWSKMKLYFMIGRPPRRTKTCGIVATGARALAVGRKHKGGRAKVTVSVSSHVPKPHTPFQWCAMDDPSEIARKQRMLQDDARQTKVDLRTHRCDESILEGVFARGDRSLGDVIEHAWRHGARFDSWAEHFKLEVWQAALDAFGIIPPFSSGPYRSLRDFPGTTSTSDLPRASWPRSIGSRCAIAFRRRAEKRSALSSTTPMSRPPKPTSGRWFVTTAAWRAICRRCARSASRS
jgi:radical SAM superfamily enzyme YgiQ (UPF0313 family)